MACILCIPEVKAQRQIQMDVPSSNVFFIPYTSAVPEREKAMLSGAAMAFAANKKVSVYLDGCQSGIAGATYPRVHYFYVLQ